MSFSTLAELIHAHIEAELHKKAPRKLGLYLYVVSSSPLVLVDSNKIKLVPNQEISAVLHSDKLQPDTTILLDNVSIKFNYAEAPDAPKVEVQTKSVISFAADLRENKLKNIELRLTLEKGQILQLLPGTRRLIRRAEKQQFAKKNFKPSKTEVLSFVGQQKKVKDQPQAQYRLPESLKNLDSQSKKLLFGPLLQFVDKDELFKLLLKKSFTDNAAKKAVRLMVVPTEAEDTDSESLQIRKRKYERGPILDLLHSYETQFSNPE